MLRKARTICSRHCGKPRSIGGKLALPLLDSHTRHSGLLWDPPGMNSSCKMRKEGRWGHLRVIGLYGDHRDSIGAIIWG